MSPDQLRLMHEVLDGEASAEEVRELDRLLATDPEARAEYEALRSLFEGLNAMRKAGPPEGMVAETFAKISSRLPRRHRLRQLSSRWRVFVSDSTRLREKSLTRGARTQRHFQGEHNYRNADMSRTKLLIGVGVAAVAVIAGAYYLNFPPSNDMSGTIAPANRSVAAQPGAADMTPSSQGDVAPASVNVADDASREGAVREGAVREGAVREGAVREGAVREGAVREGAVREGVAREGVAREGVAREGVAREGVAREGAAREGAAREAAAREAAAREGAAREAAAREAAAREGAAREGAARDAASQQ